MSTSSSAAGGDVDLKRGRESPQWTDVHDWVALSGVSPGAVALYVVLRMHVNRERGDDAVMTSTLTLAVLMGMSRGDKIKGYLDELVKLGAVDVDRTGLHRRNTYTVHQLPPPGYTGKITLKAWYAEHRALIALKRADEKAKRDARRTKAKKKDQGSPVTPDRGEQATDGSVTPDRGEHVTPNSGEPVTPIWGREPKEVEPDEVEPPTPPSGSSATGHEEKEEMPSADQPPPPSAEEILAAELIAARPDWSPRVLREVLADNAIQERSWTLVVEAFRSAATDPKTKTPRRLLHEACPHWQRAAHQLGLLPDPAAAHPATVPAPHAAPVDGGRPIVGHTPPEEFAAKSRRGRALVEAALSVGSVR